jgi:sialic acid synthase SpsE
MIFEKAKLIAEIGCNHMGDIEIAKTMIDSVAGFAGVKCAKFQKRNNKELLSEEQYNAPHPNPDNSYGDTYGEHRQFLEFNLEQHIELKEYCESKGVIYFSSVWDLTSAIEIASIKPPMIKIPSACNTNIKMLRWLLENYDGEIHLSLGMTTLNEEEMIITLISQYNRMNDLVLYACTSGYPIPFRDAHLLEVKRIKDAYGNKIKSIGYSGHHNGIAIDIAAYVLGANYIERHFTLNRTFKGTDHAASLEPDGLRRLQRNLDSTYEALTYKTKEIADIEILQRKKLKYNG